MADNEAACSASAEVIQQLRQDRLLQEAELVKERCLQEARVRLERARTDEAAAQREMEARRQLQVLQSLVEEIHRQGEAIERRVTKDHEVKVAKLVDSDDIEAFLTTFERLMKAHEIPEDQ